MLWHHCLRLLFIMSLCGCSTESAISVIENHPPTSGSLADSITVLQSADCWDDNAVGYGGSKTDVYRAYESLRSEATIDQLKALTLAENPAVALYALQALSYREPENDWPDIVASYQTDGRAVDTMSGCIIWTSTPAELAVEARGRGRLERKMEDDWR